ncbi:hypothetical protein [Chromohalobacter sp. 11-W]|uniref:hypothetical protein n=1 Tax=Chromohalobacter sp. 11-W TaxID=2994061 RepID=UPI002468D967|nr:hypothetical protein [Chromohalobacter sp. 11-W]
MQHKVLHICLSRGWGGLEMYPARIIPELARQGWRAYVLTLEGTRLAQTLADCANACRFVNARCTLARHVSGLCEIYADAA